MPSYNGGVIPANPRSDHARELPKNPFLIHNYITSMNGNSADGCARLYQSNLIGRRKH